MVTIDGTRVLKMLADKSYGSVLHEVAPVVLGPGSRLRWRWRLEQATPAPAATAVKP
jgi:hypothetical protein